MANSESRILKIKRLKKVLSCSHCPPHQVENRKKVNKHKTRKSRNYQFIIN